MDQGEIANTFAPALVRGDAHRPRRSTGRNADYLWPSGGRTIVTRSQNRAQVNGAAATSDFGDRRGMQFCLRNGDSGNTFCFAER